LLLLSPVGYDEIDADLAAQAPDHLAFPAGVPLAGDQQMELVGHVHAIGEQPGAGLGMSVIMQSRGSAPESVWNLAIRLMM